MADKMSAYGTSLWFDSEEIASVKSLGGPGLSLDTEDVTTHDQSTAWEEVVGTILRSGEVTLDLVFDPGDTTHAAILAQMVGRDYEGFELRFPDDANTAWEFNAFVTGFEPSAPVDGALTATCTIKLTGEVTLDSIYSE